MGATEGKEGELGEESMEEMLTVMLLPQDGQRAETVMSSTFISEEKSNELFAPHLQGTYFFSETIMTTAR
jgi:hypothetical protein